MYFFRELYTNPTFSQQITCTNKNNDKCVYLNVVGSKEEIFHERSGKLSDVTYVLDIRPLLVLKNCLPTTLHYCINGDDCMQFIDPGQNAHLQGVALGKTEIKLKVFEFRQLDWECVQVSSKNKITNTIYSRFLHFCSVFRLLSTICRS